MGGKRKRTDTVLIQLISTKLRLTQELNRIIGEIKKGKQRNEQGDRQIDIQISRQERDAQGDRQIDILICTQIGEGYTRRQIRVDRYIDMQIVEG